MAIDDRLHEELGLKRLNPGWPKVEILLGLVAAAVGLVACLNPPEVVAELGLGATLIGIVLVVLGAYLAMAGHRSHLYQSQNRLAAWLASRIERDPATD